MLLIANRFVSGDGPPISALALSPRGGRVVVGSQSGIAVRSAEDLAFVETIPTTLEQVHDLAFSSDGERLAAVGGVPAEEGSVELIAWPSGERLQRMVVGEDVLYDVDWLSGDGSVLVAAFDGTARLLEIPGGTITRSFDGHSRPVTAVCVLPAAESAMIVTGSIDQTLRVWDADTGETVRTLHNHTRPVHALAARPATDLPLPTIASVSNDRTVRLWQPTIGRMVRFARLDAVPLCVDWLPDGSAIVVGCEDGCVRVIDPDTAAGQQVIQAMEGRILCVAIDKAGRRVVAGGAGGQVVVERLQLAERSE